MNTAATDQDNDFSIDFADDFIAKSMDEKGISYEEGISELFDYFISKYGLAPVLDDNRTLMDYLMSDPYALQGYAYGMIA